MTGDTPRPGTTHPHLARERALKVLFAADVRGVDPRVLCDDVEAHRGALELLDELEADEAQVEQDDELRVELQRRRRLPLDDYTRALVAGVASRMPAIDDLLEEVAERWTVRRMPAVDRNLLRMAVYELAEQDTPPAVVIDEAVLLAGGFAGEKARGFVNGVLETVRRRIVAGDVVLAVTPEPVPAPPDEDVSDADASTSPVDGGAEAEAEVEVDDAAAAAYDLALGLLDDDVSLADAPERAHGLEAPLDDEDADELPPVEHDPLW